MIYEVVLDGSGGKSVALFLDGKVKQVNSILRLMFMPMERTLLKGTQSMTAEQQRRALHKYRKARRCKLKH